MRKLAALFCALTLPLFPSAALRASSAIVPTLSACDAGFFQSLHDREPELTALAPMTDFAGGAAFQTRNHEMLDAGSQTIFRRPLDDGGVKLNGYFDERTALGGVSLLNWGFLVRGRLDDVVKRLKTLLPAGNRLHLVDGAYAYTDMWMLVGWMPEANDAFAGKIAPLPERAFMIDTDIDTNDKPTGFVRIECTLQGQALPLNVISSVRPDIANPQDFAYAPPPASLGQDPTGSPIDARLLEPLASCDASFFNELYADRAELQSAGDLVVNKNTATFAVRNHQFIQDGSHVLFNAPVQDGPTRIDGFYDERLSLGGQTSTFTWGLLVKGVVGDIADQIKPQIHDAARLHSVDGGYEYSDIWKDGRWMPSDSNPKPGATPSLVARDFGIQQDVGDYSGYVRIGCYLNGNVAPSLLHTLRPDITGTN